MIGNIALAIFIVAMIANVIALVQFRHMMRSLKIALNNLIATQEQFNEIMESERNQRN